MSLHDKSGSKLVSSSEDTRRWQLALFAEIRQAPAYRSMLPRLRAAWEDSGKPLIPLQVRMGDYGASVALPRYAATFVDEMEQAATGLGLTFRGRPALWAVFCLWADVSGSWWTFSQMFTLQHAHPYSRQIDVEVSAISARVTTYRAPAADLTSSDDAGGHQDFAHVLSDDGLLYNYSMLGKDEWAAIERKVVSAARRAVADIRDEMIRDSKAYGDEPADLREIKGARERDRVLQIKRLALRISSRAGTRNDRRTDERWGKRLGIDVP